MKNVLIVNHGMEIGGAESALIGMLSAIDYTKVNIDLFLLRHSGEMLDFIPKEVTLLPEKSEYASLAVPISQTIKNGMFGVAIGRALGKAKAISYSKKNHTNHDEYIFIENSHKYTKNFMPMISNKKYDAVISYLTPHYFAAAKTKANKKIAWIHTDYTSIELNVKSELKMWSEYDVIVAISDKVRDAFVRIFPSLADRIVIIGNIHPAEFIKKRSEEFTVKNEMPDDGFIKFLSVGRYSEAKNFDNVPEICSKLNNVKWYIIGYGCEEEIIKRKISEFHMEDRVILLGKKNNPYPYFKECDFYIQPSRFEGNSVTVNEALILGKKVIISNYTTAPSQINNGVDGIIVPQDNENCAKAISEYINDKLLQEKILKHVKSTDFSKHLETEKIYELLGC